MTIAEANGERDGLITALSNSCLRWDLICEVQPVTIETQSTANSDENIKLLELVDITKSDLNKEQLDIGKDLILQYKDIFSKGYHDSLVRPNDIG
jgi:hypothetical protein